MTRPPFLSICVPSRNRQETFRLTVEGLLESRREDIELIFVDNSDDPSVMIAAMEAHRSDPRVTFIPADGTVHSMRGNWARAVDVARGEFITIIGDDDHVDPDVADLVAEVERRRPEVDVVAWARLTWSWPEIRQTGTSFFVSLKNQAHVVPRDVAIRSMFMWQTNAHVPSCPYTVYHGAVRRSALERVRSLFGGTWFEHAIVDYDNAVKLLVSARGFAYIDRPMSVLGVSARSNSAAIGSRKRTEETTATFVKENGAYEEDPHLAGFPFRTELGVASAILALQHWFKVKYNHPIAGFEANFAKAIAREVAMAATREEFEAHAGLVREAFAQWDGGIHAGHFDPVWTDRSRQIPFCGLVDTALLVREDIGHVATPVRLHDIVKQMLPEPSELVWMF